MAIENRFTFQDPLDSTQVRIRQRQMIPAQQPTPRCLTRSVDYYEQRCVKYPDRAAFHSYAEFIHALLLEADETVTSFVPQPYVIELGRGLYTPDVFVARQSLREVLELKPRAEFEAKKEISLRALFEQHDMTFRVVANEEVLKQESLALNWLPLIQVLAQADDQGIETDQWEQKLLMEARLHNSLRVESLLPRASRQEAYLAEVALMRLLHRHQLHCDLSKAPLNYDREVTAWP